LLGILVSISVILIPHNISGETKTLDTVILENNLNEQNVPSFTVGNSPVSVAVDEFNNNIVYVANSGPNTVSIVDTNTWEVSEVIVGRRPSSIAVDEFNNT
jgi:YVTN family beta-propeller protein